MKYTNLEGQTFGRWKVLQLWPERNSDNRLQYLCECSCDAHTQRLVSVRTLIGGTSLSCGCLRRERASEVNKGNTYGKANIKDLTGKKFGHLIALERLNTKCKNGTWEWKCMCDCGNEVISNTTDLNSGRKTRCNICSANATISKGEEQIASLLRKYNIPFETQKIFSTCRFPDTNSLAKFDFYINNQYLIEFDGEQHFFVSETSAWKEKNQRVKIRDNYKNQWCKENNIPLIRIPYTQLNILTIDDLMLETSKFIMG